MAHADNPLSLLDQQSLFRVLLPVSVTRALYRVEERSSAGKSKGRK